MAWSRKQPTKSGGVIAMVLGVVFAIGAFVLFASFINDQNDLENLKANGTRIEGEVVGTRHEEKKSRRSTTHYYYLRVRYTHPTGGIVATEVEVEDGAYGRFRGAGLAAPMPCTILADAANANHFAVEEAVDEQISDKSSTAMIALLIGLGVALVLGVSGFFTFKKAAALQALPVGYYPGGPYAPQGYQQPMPYPQQGAQPPPYVPPQQRLQQNQYWQPPRQN